MKAIAHDEYGSPDVLRYQDVDEPVPGKNDVLIRIRAASINPLDWRFMRGDPRILRFFLGRPNPKRRRPGVDFAGVVEAAGANTTQWKRGDKVFGACRGSFAELACTSESALAAKPDNITFAQAASVAVAGLTALQGQRDKGRLQQGQSVLINGASGGVGTFAVQVAKSFGASVTGVCSTGNVEMVRSIGADHVVDYMRSDFTDREERYDLILDCIGSHSLSACRRVLKAKGAYVLVGAPHDGWTPYLGRLLQMLVLSPLVGQRLAVFLAIPRREDLSLLADLMEAGTIKPVIDRIYPLRETAEAVRYQEQGHARGKVVIDVDRAGET